MLKITRQTSSKSVMLVLEGRLAGPWVDELERSWRENRSLSSSTLVIDLTGVTFIDQEAKTVLAHMCREGAELVAAGCCTKSIVEEIKSSVQMASPTPSGKKLR